MQNPLLTWALDAHSHQAGEQSPKRRLLADINNACGTRYSEPHLNSWIAGRKPTPRRVWEHLARELIETELGLDQPALAAELIRIMALGEQ